MKELTLSGGGEYVFKLNTFPLTAKAGAGFDVLLPLEFWDEENEFYRLLESGYYIGKARTMLLYTWQAGLYYEFIPLHTLHLTYARKNHFPTMAQRYSTRFGSVLPNSRLGPEKANHVELGYTGAFLENAVFQKLTIHAAAYYSIIEGKMTTVQIANPGNPSQSVDYTRNLDSVSFYGIEISPALYINDYFSAHISFSWNAYYINKTIMGAELLSYYPQITSNGYLIIHPKYKAISIIPRFEYISARYAYTAPRPPDPSETAELTGYALFHLKLSAAIGKHITLSAACDNIFDTLYEIRLYSPQRGRSFTLTLEARY